MKPRKRRVYGTEDRNFLIMVDYVMKGLTVYEIGKKYGVTPQRVSNLLTDKISDELRQKHKEAKAQRIFKELTNLQ